MPDRSTTRLHNLDLLVECGFKQLRNTSVFLKSDLGLISPAVDENRSGGRWFDLRKVNLDRLPPKSYLFIRIVPDLFVLEPLDKFFCLIDPCLMGNRPHSGDVWGNGIELGPNLIAYLFNKSASETKIESRLLSFDEAKTALNSLK
jgi:hypothetical protein